VTTGSHGGKLIVVNGDINTIELRALDLNLLVVLDAIHRQRSIRLAARKLHLGAPAVSMALRRLRDLVGDPLFVRTATGMEPTARGSALHAAVAPALARIHEAMLARPAFHPGREQRTIRFALPDDLEVALLPRLLETLHASAPGVTLVVRPSDFRVVGRMIDEGEADLVLVATPTPLEARHRHQRLYRERLATLFDPRRVRVRKLTRAAFLRVPHLLQSPSGVLRSRLDEVIAATGDDARRTLCAVTHFSTLPFVLQRMAALVSMPEVSAHHYARAFGLAVRPLPYASPTFDVALAWHARLDADPAMIWFRGLVTRLALELREEALRRPAAGATASRKTKVRRGATTTSGTAR
jgi:DNA-binding transcriptional LysR family regulator